MDRTVADTFYIMFTTRAFATGIPTTLAGTPVVSAYEDNSVTQITAGITLGVDHDGVTGLNLLTIVATGANGYESGKDYNMVITTGTVGGVSVVGEVVGKFSLNLSAAAVDLANGTDGLGAIKTVVDAIPTTAMRGTDGANTTTPPTAAAIADQVHDEAIEDHDTQGTAGWATALAVYAGSDGPGIYIDSGAANTNTVVGTDGTEINPVSTFVAARTLADALGLKIYYLEGNSDITLAATHLDWEFIGIGSVSDNVVNFGSQDVSRSLFRNLTLEGTQGGAGRITARDCALQDPGAGATTLHIFAERCGFVDEIEVDASNDNVFDQCFSLVAGTATPAIIATGAAGTISVRHYSGGLEFKALSASHNVTWEGIGQVVFNANCNVNANVSVRGIGSITDNTAGMASLTETSLVNMTKINTEADTALTDYDAPTKAEMDTAHALLATAAALTTVDTVVDAIKAVTDLLPDSGALTAIGTDTARLTAVRAAVLTDWINGGRLDLLLDAIPTTAMRGTDSAALASVATEARLAELDAANLPADISAILADTSELQTDDVPGLIAALNDLSAANVNAEVLDVMATDVIAELTGIADAPATPTHRQAIMLIYMWLRNDSQSTSSERRILNDAGTEIMDAVSSDDGTTFKQGKMTAP